MDPEHQPLLENNTGDRTRILPPAAATVEQPERKKPSPYTVCIPILIFVINAGMVIAVQQQWLILYLCSRFRGLPTTDHKYLPGLFDNNPIVYPDPDFAVCRAEPDIQAMASKWSMVVQLCSGIPSLVLGPVYGVLSDRIGRKPLLLVPMISAFLTFMTYLGINRFNIGLWLLMVTGIFSGLLGSFTVMLTATLAYFADTTEPSERGRVFVMGESVFFVGFALGPLLGGSIARNVKNGTDTVFAICAVGSIVVFVLTALFLPESLDKSAAPNPSDISFGRDGPLQSIRKSISDVVSVFRDAASPTFMYMVFGLCSVAAALSGRSLFFYYVSYRFGWDAQDEGQYILVSCIARLAHMLGTFQLLTYWYKDRCTTKEGKARFDLWLIRGALFVSSASAVLNALAPKGWMLYVIACVEAIGTLANPTLRSLLSGSVPSSSQGLLFSGVTFTEHVLGMIFGIIFPNIWSYTVRTHPNFFLYVIASLMLLAGCFLLLPSPENVLDTHLKDDGEEDVIEREE
jgi:MFS family permease